MVSINVSFVSISMFLICLLYIYVYYISMSFTMHLFIIYLFFYKNNKIVNFILCNQSLYVLTSMSMHFARDKSRK
jgi:hypothetical protein